MIHAGIVIVEAALSLKAQGVGLIAETISEIAGRTNLLALNASIEAARAGEYGRGFAVVAGEAKALPNQTTAAMGEIQKQIQAIRSSSGEAVDTIDAMNRTIAALRESSTAVSCVVEQQNAATHGIAANVGEAAKQTVTASGNIRLVSQFASEAGQVADFVALSADDGNQGDRATARRRPFPRSHPGRLKRATIAGPGQSALRRNDVHR